ncbi:hypothetical protein TSAR_001854, partial [Trichomalopsis sarcophagae]
PFYSQAVVAAWFLDREPSFNDTFRGIRSPRSELQPDPNLETQLDLQSKLQQEPQLDVQSEQKLDLQSELQPNLKSEEDLEPQSKQALEQHLQFFTGIAVFTTMPYSRQFVQLNNYTGIDDDEILFSMFDLQYFNGVSKMHVGVSKLFLCFKHIISFTVEQYLNVINDETNEYDEILKSLPTPSAPEPCSLSKSESCPNPSVSITPSYITPALSSPILYNALTNSRKPILKSVIPVNIPLLFNKKQFMSKPLTKSSPINIPLPNNNKKLLIAGCSPISN